MIGHLILLKDRTDFFSGLLRGSIWEWAGFVVSLVALVILIWMVVRVRTWLQGDDDHAGADCELLDPLRELQQQGHFSEEDIRLMNSRRKNSEKSNSGES